MMNGEDVVGKPEHIGLVAVHNPFDLIGDARRRAPAMGLAERRVAAPAAMVRASARSDHGNGSRAMMFTPGAQVAGNVDSLAVGPRLRVEVGEERRGAGMDGIPAFRPIPDAGNQLGWSVLQERFQSQLAFTRNHDLRAGGDVLSRIIRRLGTADYYLPAAGARVFQDGERVRARHQVDVDSDGCRRARLENPKQRIAGPEGGIVDLYVEAAAAEVRRKVEDSQGNIGLHDLKLLGVLVQKIAVGQQEIHMGTLRAPVSFRAKT